MKNALIEALPIAASSLTHAQTDRSIDSDGQWDADQSGTDRDVGNEFGLILPTTTSRGANSHTDGALPHVPVRLIRYYTASWLPERYLLYD